MNLAEIVRKKRYVYFNIEFPLQIDVIMVGDLCLCYL